MRWLLEEKVLDMGSQRKKPERLFKGEGKSPVTAGKTESRFLPACTFIQAPKVKA